MRILVVEDDRSLGKFLRLILVEEGHAVDLAATGEEGLARTGDAPYDLILLDLSLPDFDGLTLLERLRAGGDLTPVLVVSGRSEGSTIVRALDLGADGYLVKPVGTIELKARVRAIARRTCADDPRVLRVANVELRCLAHEARVSGDPVPLSPKEFQLLTYFMERPEVVIPRSELLEQIWHMRFDPGTNIVDVAVSRLRTKLERAQATPVLLSVRGVGFTLRVGD